MKKITIELEVYDLGTEGLDDSKKLTYAILKLFKGRFQKMDIRYTK